MIKIFHLDAFKYFIFSFVLIMLANYMAESGEKRGKEQFSPQVNGFSRDLLHKVVNGNDFISEFEVDGNGNEQEKDDEDLELSLGLSLNGKFGVDPKRAKMKLMRSSSVSNFMISGEENRTAGLPIAAFVPLTRTCSMPTETEEEWKKRKELQSLRRMEAKRRRLDKLKFQKAGKDKGEFDGNSSEENGSNVDSNDRGSVSSYANGNAKVNGLLSQRSIGSQGSGSSCLSEFESQPIKVNKNNEVRSPSSSQSKMQHDEGNPATTPWTAHVKSAICIGAGRGTKESKDMIKNDMLDMPCVSTTGDGPNGKKIEGFLYSYRKGEEVKIMCVCHGSFLSPAEFVKHAGGGDVEHPLRHIVVCPSPFLQ